MFFLIILYWFYILEALEEGGMIQNNIDCGFRPQKTVLYE